MKRTNKTLKLIKKITFLTMSISLLLSFFFMYTGECSKIKNDVCSYK